MQNGKNKRSLEEEMVLHEEQSRNRRRMETTAPRVVQRGGEDQLRNRGEGTRCIWHTSPSGLRGVHKQETPVNDQELHERWAIGWSPLGSSQRNSPGQHYVLFQGGRGSLACWQSGGGTGSTLRPPRLVRACATGINGHGNGCGLPHCACTILELGESEEGGFSPASSLDGAEGGDDGSTTEALAGSSFEETGGAAFEEGDMDLGSSGRDGEELAGEIPDGDEERIPDHRGQALRHSVRIRDGRVSRLGEPRPGTRPGGEVPVYRLGTPEERDDHEHEVQEQDGVLHQAEGSGSG